MIDMDFLSGGIDGRLYNDYGSWLRRRFPFRVQKISVDAGFSCPNRDGRVGWGGCVFCDNRTFSPAYTMYNEQCTMSDVQCTIRGVRGVREQIEAGKRFFGRKYSDMRFLAYFQAYTNTYAPVDVLRGLYEEALSVDGVVGLVVGTRPDCVSDDVLDLLAELGRRAFVVVEYGIESANDVTLGLINRGHSFGCARRAVERTAERGIMVGGHVILGLPGEDAAECLRQAGLISDLRLDFLKIHQLQVVRGTRLAEWYAQCPWHVYTVDEYVELVAGYIQRLRWSLVLERFVSQSPQELVVAPRWGLKNHEFADRLAGYMRRRGMRQGQLSPT